MSEDQPQDLRGPCKGKCFLATDEGVEILHCEYRARHTQGHKAKGITFKHRAVYAMRKPASTDDMLKALVLILWHNHNKEPVGENERRWLDKVMPRITSPGKIYYVGTAGDDL